MTRMNTCLIPTRGRGSSGLLAISPQTRASLHGDGLVLLHTGKSKGLVFTSNRTGAQIWQGVASGQSPQAIAAQLSIEYGVPRAQVEDDTTAFLADLVHHGILVPHHGSASRD